MSLFTSILITLASFIIMEGVAWFSHKYLMHGLLWFFHEDHHQHNTNLKPFERNDFFFLLFATPGILLIFIGFDILSIPFWIGLGIASYGFAYFIIHDVFIHRRLKWFRKTNSAYFRALQKAHKAHHKHFFKEDGECFGMLWVPLKYYNNK
ncbi:MAG: sterol desaturase family protein [Vicingaceae bacterium]|nr:sterol desaturase family protein [Vicingaceae bacterium]